MIPINIQPIEKRVEADNGSVLQVHSVFYTIQGEGPFTGFPAVFIRLAGCNLQCPSCDTDYTVGRTETPALEIAVQARNLIPFTFNLKLKLAVITGGEPFRQNITSLVRRLQSFGFMVQVETNGTLPPSPGFPEDAVVVCSPKAGKVNSELAQRADAYKYVLSHDSVCLDGLPILALNHTAKPEVARPHSGYKGPIYLQPMDSQDSAVNAKNLAAVVTSCMKFGYQLQLQVHKIINVA